MNPDSSKQNSETRDEIPPEITIEAIERFRPQHPSVSSSWRSTLDDIRQSFVQCSDEHETLKCVMTHSIVPQWPARPDGPYPSAVDGMEPIAMGGGPCNWPQQQFLRREGETETVVSDLAPESDKSYRLKFLDVASQLELGDATYSPIVGETPIQNVTGKPVLFSDGQPVAMRHGVERSYFVYAGGPPHRRITSVTSFFSLAGRAGQTLYGLPADVNQVVWRDWIDGFPTIGDKGMWISALFELAWQSSSDPALSAERYGWDGPTSTLIESSQSSDLPAHWYSVIDDLVAASIVAAEFLLDHNA